MFASSSREAQAGHVREVTQSFHTSRGVSTPISIADRNSCPTVWGVDWASVVSQPWTPISPGCRILCSNTPSHITSTHQCSTTHVMPPEGDCFSAVLSQKPSFASFAWPRGGGNAASNHQRPYQRLLVAQPVSAAGVVYLSDIFI